jgi:TolB-like protein/Tfp pilus assembly protein PilF
MKRCPQCNRAETDEALTFCRVDGTPLVRESGAVTDSAGTLNFSPARGADTTETRIFPTGETPGRPTAPTTTLDAHRAGGTRELSERKLNSRRGIIIAAAAIILAALAASSYFYLSRGKSAAAKNSIAVLPFVNASSDPDAEYLSDGITESLINSLSQLPGLAVKARSTVFRYKGKESDPQKVGAELNVQAVLNGRVVERGDDLTLSLELVDTKTGDQMWGAQYSRKLSDLVTLQGEIARDVSNKLRVKLSGADEQRLAKNYTGNAAAYQLYLRGRFYWNKSTVENNRKAIELFNQAIVIDPNYALAYAGIADAYPLLFFSITPQQAMSKAREAALKALSLDNNLAEAHAALGVVLRDYDYDFAAAEREFKTAIELNPNYAAAHDRYGTLLSRLARHEEAFAEHRRALEIEPLSLGINRNYGEAFIFARRYDEAIAQLKKTLELDSSFVAAHVSLGFVYQLKGMYAESVEERAKVRELQGDPQSAGQIRESFAKGGWEGFLRNQIEDRKFSNPSAYISAYVLATSHAALGEKDRAFAELNKSFENREYFMTLLKVDPRLDPLRSDPRFADLMREVRLPQ